MQSRLLRVLIVEDNPDDALLMIRQLKREGFDLRETVVDTCEQLSSHLASAEFDVVLSDYNLGASNGQDCLSKVRELKPDLPFILVSGKIGEEAAVELMKQGAQDFVLKDQLARLGSVIQRELDERVRRNEADLAKKALRESESRYRLLFENLHDPVFISDKDKREIIDCNAAAVDRFGYSREELIGMDPTLVHAEEEREKFIEYIRESPRMSSERWTLLTKDGTRVPVESRVTELNAFGRRLRTVIVRDLSEVERYEREAARREEYLAALLENINDAVIILSRDGKLLYQSPVSEKILGYDEQAYQDKTLFGLVHDEDREWVAEEFEKLLSGDKVNSPVQFRVRHCNGIWVDIEANAANLLDNEIVNGILVSFSDVTERLQAEERFRVAFQTSPDAFVISGVDDGKLVEVNDGFVRLYGKTREEIIGKSSREILLWADSDLRNSLKDVIVREGEVSNVEAKFYNADGELFDALVSSKLIFLNSVPHILTIARDITNLKHAEEERAQLLRQLMQSQKLETVGRLAGGVAHDFNNLLTAITISTELAMTNLDDEKSLVSDLEQIQEVTLRAASLTRQLLTFSRSQVVDPHRIDLAKVMVDMERMLRRIIGEDISLVVEPKREMLHVKVDPAQMEQVIVNLAVNARDAMPQGGRLEIVADIVTVEKAICHICSERFSGEFVALSVRDTGVGMSEKVMTNIFDPFFTTKEDGKGTGLGLATVMGIVDQADGHLNVVSTPGKGSEFNVFLPMCHEESAQEEEKPEDMEAEEFRGRVLVVDDEESVLSTISRALEKVGYHVQSANCGERALELVESVKVPFDFIVTDIIMPNMSGDELVARLMETNPEIQPIFMSGYAPEVIRERAQHINGARFLQKPFGPKRLIEELHKRTTENKE